MFFFIYLFLLLISTIIINNQLIKKNILINFTGDKHQKFASKLKIPLTGGIFLFFGILFFLHNNHLSLILFTFLILILGIFSDLKLIHSAILRLLFQITFILCFTIFNDIQITNTRILLLDEILKNDILNYVFVSFCILIVINGSNFIDGLNTLNIGYYLLIVMVIIFSVRSIITFDTLALDRRARIYFRILLSSDILSPYFLPPYQFESHPLIIPNRFPIGLVFCPMTLHLFNF